MVFTFSLSPTPLDVTSITYVSYLSFLSFVFNDRCEDGCALLNNELINRFVSKARLVITDENVWWMIEINSGRSAWAYEIFQNSPAVKDGFNRPKLFFLMH